MSWQTDVEPRPALLVLPPGDVDLSEAHAAIELWEFYSGKTLDGTQRLVVEVLMALDGDLWAAGTTGREMPRQNGKGDEIEVVEFWGITQRGERILHTVHEAVLLATEAQDRMLSLFNHRDLRPRIERGQVWRGVGQQMIRVADSADPNGGRGGTIWYRTRTKGGARGVDKVDRVVMDEAQHVQQQHLDAVGPTMQASPNPQINALGTAALPELSHWWWEVRRRALRDDPGRFGYVGHTAERVYLDGDRVVQEPVDVDDKALWLVANPALHAGRGTGMSFFEEERENLGPVGFAQEHLCVWAPYPGQDGGFLPVDIWRELVVDEPKVSQVCFGLSVAPDGAWASVASAGRLPDGSLYFDNVKHERGTDWVLDDVTERWQRKKIPLRLNPASVEGSFIRQLTERDVDIVEVTGREYQQACGEVLDAIKNRNVYHIDQPPLNAAVGAAQRREIGKEGGWVWAEPLSGVDLSPLKAATLALSGVAEPEDRSAVNNVW